VGGLKLAATMSPRAELVPGATIVVRDGPCNVRDHFKESLQRAILCPVDSNGRCISQWPYEFGSKPVGLVASKRR
jgi:hypothetical protein